VGGHGVLKDKVIFWKAGNVPSLGWYGRLRWASGGLYSRNIKSIGLPSTQSFSRPLFFSNIKRGYCMNYDYVHPAS
jgi:hypothetical protein